MREIVSVISAIGVYFSLTLSSSAQEVCTASEQMSTSEMRTTIVVGSPVISSNNMNNTVHSGSLYNSNTGTDSSSTRYSIRVFLSGPFKTDDSELSRNLQAHIPSVNPYQDTSTCLSNTHVNGSVPNHVVDWVVVELRDPNSPSLLLTSTLGFLTYSGSIVGVDGSPWIVLQKQQGVDSAFIVVRHRNHLAVMSATPISHALGEVHILDLTDFNNIYTDFSEPAEYSGGVAMMYPGDVLRSGIINARDRVLVRNRSGEVGYNDADTNLDGLVNAIDRIAVVTRTFVATQVP